jgi:hypothetical protein
MQFSQPIVDERRREGRQPTQVACTITELGDTEQRGAMACIVDWSSRGIGLVTTQALPIGSAVAVEYAGVLILAEVRSCIPDQRAFRIGLQIDQGIATTSARLGVGDAVHEIQARLEEYEALAA